MQEIKLEQVRKGERFILDDVPFIKLDEDNEAFFLVAEKTVINQIAFDDQTREYDS